MSPRSEFWAIFFLPLGRIDMLACLFIVSALLASRLGRDSITSIQKG